MRILCLLSFIAFFACDVPEKMESSNILVVESFIKALENKDLSSLDSLTHERFYIVGPSVGDTIYKKDWLEEWQISRKNIVESVDFKGSTISQLQIPSRTEMGDWIGEWSVVEIKYFNVDEPVQLFANTNYLVVDGKLAKGLAFYNAADINNQLGYIYSKSIKIELDSL